jgi:hypothetical protein
MAAPSPRQLIVSLSLRRPIFDPRPVNPRFVMGKVALGQVFLPGPGFSAMGIIPPNFHTHLHIHAGITRRTNGLRKLKKKELQSFGRGSHWINQHFHRNLDRVTSRTRNQATIRSTWRCSIIYSEILQDQIS